MLTPYGNQMVKQALLQGKPLMPSGEVWLGLLSDLGDAVPNEVNYLNYERQRVFYHDVTNVPSVNSNVVELPLPPVTHAPETILDYGLYDKAAGGNCWMTGTFLKNGRPHGLVLSHATPITIDTGVIVVNFR